MAELEAEIESLRQVTAFKPTTTQFRVNRAFPDMAIKCLDIITNPDGDGYILVVDGQYSRVVVPEELGRLVVGEKFAHDQAQARIKEGEGRLAELSCRITCLRQAIPTLKLGVQHHLGRLGDNELNTRLGGQFVNFTLNDQGEPVALVLREVNEVLTEVPDWIKQRYIAWHLTGARKLSGDVQKALGINAAIDAVTNALKPAPEAPKLAASEEAPRPKTATKSMDVGLTMEELSAGE
jgi:hypothetical protein